jgi:hypothetical protein
MRLNLAAEVEAKSCIIGISESIGEYLTLFTLAEGNILSSIISPTFHYSVVSHNNMNTDSYFICAGSSTFAIAALNLFISPQVSLAYLIKSGFTFAGQIAVYEYFNREEKSVLPSEEFHAEEKYGMSSHNDYTGINITLVEPLNNHEQ